MKPMIASLRLTLLLAGAIATQVLAANGKVGYDFKEVPGVSRATTHVGSTAMPAQREFRHIPSANAASNPAEGIGVVPVTVVVDPDSTGSNMPFSVSLIRKDGATWGDDFKPTTLLEVPAGEYLLEVTFVTGNFTVVFLPDLEINGPTELHVNRDMATNRLSIDPVLPDGSKVRLPVTDEEGISVNDDYNTLMFRGIVQISYDGVSKCASDYSLEAYCQDYEDMLTIYTNVTDDRGRFLWLTHAMTPDGTSAFRHYTADCAESAGKRVLTASADDFHPLSQCFFGSPTADPELVDGVSMEYTVYDPSGRDMMALGFWSYVPLETYLGDTFIDDEVHSLLYTSSIENLDYGKPLGMTAPGVAYDGYRMRYYATQYNSDYAAPDSPLPYMLYPVNEAFSFSDNPELEFGNSGVYCSTTREVATWADPRFEYIAPATYRGNNGELRLMDLFSEATTVEVRHDGQTVLEKSPYLYIYQWAETWASEGGKEGSLTYVFHNGNIEVDEIPGCNICEVTQIQDADNNQTPTLQRLMIHDVMDNPCIRFMDSEEAYISLTGGAFVSHDYKVDMGEYDYDSYWYGYAPVSLQVEYAPYGTDAFAAIEVEELSDFFMMPGFGAYWDANLACIDRKSPNGWFDLRVTLTDELGNCQRQTISPAFYIENLISATDCIESEDDAVRIENGVLIAPESAIIYDLSGRRVMDGVLAPGLYLVRNGPHTAKILL